MTDIPEEQEQIRPEAVTEPKTPGVLEKVQHDLTHLPFRAWCPLCVQAKSKDDAHWSKPDEEKKTESVDEKPVVQADLTYIDGVPLMALYCTERGYGTATVLESKAVTEFVISWTLRMLEIMGLNEVIFQVDPEQTTRALAERVCERRQQQTLLRETPRRSKQGLGGVSRYHRLLQ